MSLPLLQNVSNFKSKTDGDLMAAISPGRIDQVFEPWRDLNCRDRLYPPRALVPTWTMQMLRGCSCSEAIAIGQAAGCIDASAVGHTAAYCNARVALDEAAVRDWSLRIGTHLAEHARPLPLTYGRPLKSVDGTSVQTPDTPPLQAAYPQPSNQKRGCGFPVMYIVGLLDLASGAVIDLETYGRHDGSELEHWHELWRSVESGDIVVADALYHSFSNLAGLQRRGADLVACLNERHLSRHQRRRIQRRNDAVLTLQRPKAATLEVEGLPDTLRVRVVRIARADGSSVRLITTLVDRKKWSRSRLASIYARRWEVELRLRDIKTTMGCELLRCQSPSMCRKELYMAIAAYNLVRTVMYRASRGNEACLARLSFKHTIVRILALPPSRSLHADRPVWQRLIEQVASFHNPKRNRPSEPRKRKRRPKAYPLMTLPRHKERELLRTA